MSSNYNDVLSVLDAINKEAMLPLYIPSLQKTVNFKNISTGQQKSILKAAVDNPVFQTRFTIAFYNLLQENCEDQSIVNKLTTIDAAAIAIQLRVLASGPEYVLQQNNNRYKINLQTIIDKLKAVIIPEGETITNSNFSIQVGAPLISEHYDIEKQLREKNINDQQLLNAQITETIGDAFVGEISKFIKSIKVTYNKTTQDVNYTSLSFAKRHSLLEKISNNSIQGVLKYMEKYVTEQKDLLTVSGTNVNTGEVVNDLILLVDSTLFIVS
jgi:hypothetical protein